VAWQGGEPTLMGLDFYRRSVEFEKSCAKPGAEIENTFQTNGILPDDGWCDAGDGTIEERKTGLGSQADPRRHTGEGEQVAAQPTAVRPGRNEACFCGSGNRFKKCHG